MAGPAAIGLTVGLGGCAMDPEPTEGVSKMEAEQGKADGFTEDQQFFIAVGQAWCGKSSEADIKRRLVIDGNPPARFRVNGALSNLPEFAEAFSCGEGTPMRRATTCELW